MVSLVQGDPLTRRGLIALAGIGLVGGCSTDAGRINRAIFGAVKKDPIYAWRPEWVTGVSDEEFPLGGIYPQAAARLRHSLSAAALPSSAVDDAAELLLTSGWHATLESGVTHYTKPVEGTDLALSLRVSTSTVSGVWLDMNFYGMAA